MMRFTFYLEYVLLVIVCTVPRVSLMGPGGKSGMQYTITDVRLISSEPMQSNSGRVQVQIEGSSQWIDVCDDMWGDNDARVVCRQLGFPAGLGYRLRRLTIPAGDRSAGSVRRFECDGSDSTLSDCDHERRDMMCDSNKGAGVLCIPLFTGVQLGDGGPLTTSGRVRVQINNSTWLDVCFDNKWGEEEGRVVCRQLGFQDQPATTGSLVFTPVSEIADLIAVGDFKCMGTESSLLECEHKSKDRCGGMHGRAEGAKVTCTPFPTTEPPAEVTTAVRPTAEITTRVETTIYITGTTETEEVGGTTIREAVNPGQTTAKPSQNSPVTIETRTAGVTEPSPDERDDTTTKPTAGDGEFDAQGGSNLGAYVGLALGCVLFVVCASVIVACLLKRHRRQEKNPPVADLRSSGVVFQQHSATYEAGSNHIKMREFDSHYCAVEEREKLKIEAGYVAPNPSPVKTFPVSSKQKPSSEFARKIENPYYLEIDGGKAPEDTAPKSGPESDDAYYFKLQPDTAGAVGDKAPPQPAGDPDEILDNLDGDDVDDHYYSYAKPETTKLSDSTEDVYTYADAPREDANNAPPNACDYFVIEEGGDAMGSPTYNVGEKGGGQPAAEGEYTYVDPAKLRDESTDETEGWVENTVYIAGP